MKTRHVVTKRYYCYQASSDYRLLHVLSQSCQSTDLLLVCKVQHKLCLNSVVVNQLSSTQTVFTHQLLCRRCLLDTKIKILVKDVIPSLPVSLRLTVIFAGNLNHKSQYVISLRHWLVFIQILSQRKLMLGCEGQLFNVLLFYFQSFKFILSTQIKSFSRACVSSTILKQIILFCIFSY